MASEKDFQVAAEDTTEVFDASTDAQETLAAFQARVRETVQRKAGASVPACLERLHALVMDRSGDTPGTVQRLAALDLIELAGAKPTKQPAAPQVVIQLPSMKVIEELVQRVGDARPEDLIAEPVPASAANEGFALPAPAGVDDGNDGEIV